MAYDEALAARVHAALVAQGPVEERRMFGGIAFMVGGHMCCGVLGKDLMLRLGEAGATEALGKPHVRPMDFTHRPMKTMVFVAPEGYRGGALGRWLALARAHAAALPAKGKKTPGRHRTAKRRV